MTTTKYEEWFLTGNISGRFQGISLNRVLCVDLETTGVDSNYDEILQLSICDGYGREVLNKLYKPTHTSSWPQAQEIHGIRPVDVKRCKSFNRKEARSITTLLSHAELIIGYNFFRFDKKFLENVGVTVCKPCFDVMLEFAPVLGQWDDYHNHWKWSRLNKCAEHYNYTWEGNAHDALADVRATAFCFRAMIADGSDYCKTSNFIANKDFDAVLKDWSGRSRKDHLTYPEPDVLDDDVVFCYVRKLPEGLLSQRAEKALNMAIEERNGRRYKSKAKGAKWTVITDPEQDGCLCEDTFNRDHSKGKKVCYLPNLLDYLGVDRKGFDTRWESGRKRCVRKLNQWLPLPPQLKRLQSQQKEAIQTASSFRAPTVETQKATPAKTFIENVGYVKATLGEELKPLIKNDSENQNAETLGKIISILRKFFKK